MKEQSECFRGNVGQFGNPINFPQENYVMTRGNYDYEGNWAFCVFNDPYIVGARFGYGAGKFDARDYFPDANSPHPDYMQLHVEIMTQDGAFQWVNSVDFSAADLKLDDSKFDQTIVKNGIEILRLKDWPNLKWNMSSDDEEASLQMELRPITIAVLPDNRMPSQIFSMFLAFCDIHGTIKLNGQSHIVSGTAFYDHTRIRSGITDALPYGMNFYTPVRLSDGSFFGAYFTTDHLGNQREGYCFALYYGADGYHHYFQHHLMKDIQLDDDGLPQSWTSELDDGEITLKLTCQTRPICFKKGWGNPAPESRRNNYNFPLLFDAQVEVKIKEEIKSLEGVGLAEYLIGGHQIPKATIKGDADK